MSSPDKKSKWIPLTLTLTVLPGMGHFYLKQKWKGVLFSGLALLLAVGFLARFLSVLFALANLRQNTRPTHWNPLELVLDTWRLDYPVLLSFLGLLLLIWVIAAGDLWWQLKKS
jgi:hypothetical protein